MFITTSSSSKRRRIQRCPIYDLLQGGLLEEVAKYLAPPSQIIFALAITPPKSPYEIIMAQSRSRSRSSTLLTIGNDWDFLDFGQIEKDLAAKLSDNDMISILVHIDAINKVKRLKLTNCTNITGVGLRPLRFSTVIEQIDLSLVGQQQRPELDPEPPISCELVLPVLYSIVNQDRCALKHLEFPKIWRDIDDDTLDTTGLTQFIMEYNEMIENRGATSCSKCHQTLEHPYQPIIMCYDDERDYGIQMSTCHQCLKYYCANCTDEDGNTYLNDCYTCERRYCKECCATKAGCASCPSKFCPGCLHHNCTNCNAEMCDFCYLEDFGPCDECKLNWCSQCNGIDDLYIRHCHTCGVSRCCRECSEKEGVNGVHKCHRCDLQSCDECRMKECQNGNNTCPFCLQMIAPLLFKEIKRLKNRNRSLGRRIQTLEYDKVMLQTRLRGAENRR